MKTTISIIGGGNMGSAIIAGIRKSFNVYVCEKDASRVRQLKSKYKIKTGSLESVTGKSQVIILATKPQDFDGLLEALRPLVRDQLVISIAAGITTAYIEKRLGRKVRVVRTMPNLPALVGQAMTGICKGKFAKQSDLNLAVKIFNQIGRTVVVKENLINSITALSGSGPAYVFYFVECLERSAKTLGLEEKISRELILQTLKGSLTLLERSGESAGVLRARVTSKGGTTQAALEVFTNQLLYQLFEKALLAAKRRAQELSK